VSRGDPAIHQNDFFASYIGSTVIIPVDGAVRSNATVLRPGHYTLYCRETGVYLRQSGATLNPSAADMQNSFLIEARTYRDLTVDDADNGYLWTMTADGLAGSLRLTYASNET
jgi:hypothetical protein